MESNIFSLGCVDAVEVKLKMRQDRFKDDDSSSESDSEQMDSDNESMDTVSAQKYLLRNLILRNVNILFSMRSETIHHEFPRKGKD